MILSNPPLVAPCGRRLRAGLRAGFAGLLAVAASVAASARCVDEDRFDVRAEPAAAASGPAPAADPMTDLRAMVRDALARSQAIGASRLLAEAAERDTDEARAAKRPQASLNGGIGPAVERSGGVTETLGAQMRAGVNISQLLWDGGRSDRVIDWRSQLASAARWGYLNSQEQVALNTVSLALERSRYRMQVEVYDQYVRKMGCLVEALEHIVGADRGRLSELVQAQKSLQQAELAQVQAVSQTRQTEVRLRRLVGDGLPPTDGLATVLLDVPALGDLQADAARSAEIEQLDAQAAAMRELARSVEAATKPQLSWNVGGSAATGVGGNIGGTASARSGSFGAGLSISIPLLHPGSAAATDAARKRAQAAELQRGEALDARRYRIAEVHEQAQSSFDRVRRTAAVLRDSERVRNFTLQQWQQLGRRSLFDVMAAEGEHYNLRVAYVNALHDGLQMNALLHSLGRGLAEWLH